MRILHTADWHLGHRLYNHDRTPEHAAALQWLEGLIEREAIDVVIVAGDVFDVSNPSNQARQLYYQFLSRLLATDVAAAIVVGGNHDSPSMLDAPREVLQELNLHVVGAARSQVQSQVVTIRTNREGEEEELIVAAVPFLRERDVRSAKFGESPDERMTGIKQGIQDHFTEIGAAAVATRSANTVPILATGHLFVGGATDSEDKKSHIYQADENNIDAGNFPNCFDYVALGHVHRAQSVNGQDNIRYCGSLVPLTFVEGMSDRSVRIVDIGKAGEPVSSRKIPVPTARKLYRLHGTLDVVKAKLRAAVAEHLNREGEDILTPWAEVRVLTDDRIHDLPEQLAATVLEVAAPEPVREPIKFLRRSQERLSPAPAAAPQQTKQLDELSPVDVFQLLCAAEELSEEVATEVLTDFRDLINWKQDQDND
ncbi:exonuclease SbcCD subunit D C-terminal domain-containing protein [Lewinella sp. 4G2]|uniref:exonuclease SbcCD subunit D C-terminal domain-containing protein n=1 Tax=Lewinella sp. 4G2 TaxID=1803372 RepID=UPI0007B4C2B4|nr:exonuclease SbcCD subunit D C-terminal domain-containing protein [Lewinella sp. 4G2]OAV44701.1 hypothetical protein A3850_009450 [Lewinella sp. 4G2]